MAARSPQRGPLVYCMEQIDQGEGVALKDVALVQTERRALKFEEKFDQELLGRVFEFFIHIRVCSVYEETADRGSLYFLAQRRHRQIASRQLHLYPLLLWGTGPPGPNPDASLDPVAREREPRGRNPELHGWG